MPRRGATAAAAGDDAAAEQVAPRRSARVASLPKTDEVKPAAKPRATRKRTVDDVNAPGAVDEGGQDKGKTKKAKADTSGDSGGSGEDDYAAADPVPQIGAVDIGDTLPSLVLKNEKGEDVQIAEIANDKGAVVFLVPKADTPGCTNQACGFRDIFSEFTEHDYTVYCLSADSPNAQTKWQTKKELPYSLISDPNRVLISALGAGEGGKTKRSHFIFEKGGKLVDKKIPVKPVDSPKLALDFIKGAPAS